MSGQTRREFLKTGAFSTLFLGSGALAGCSAIDMQSAGRAKNVIFMVSDGMSSGTLTMADLMLRRRDGRRSNWIRLYEEGLSKRALMDMASANAIVTDSAAASSSWGCGQRINNNGVNWGVNDESLKPLLPIFRDAGKSTGLVTTTEITHATPAGFAASVRSRNMGEEIASQYLERRVDLLLGGANRHFDPQQRRDERDLYSEFQMAGYSIVRNKTELQEQGSGTGPVLGIFANGHLPYTLDHINIPENLEAVPTLSEMTDMALTRLSLNSEGFILQVEGGKVDHAAHANDVGGLIFDQIAFDEAIGVVLAFAENRDDTLVIITSDHGNANPAFNQSSDQSFDRIQEFKFTNSWIKSGLNEMSTDAEIRQRIEEATGGIVVTVQEAEILREAMQGSYTATYRAMSDVDSVIGQILANYTHVNFTGGNHTADYVELASFGPGSETLEGFVRNTHLFDVVTAAAGVTDYVQG